MAEGKIQLKGKYLKALKDYFESPETYEPRYRCEFDDAYDAALVPVCELFENLMTRLEVYDIAYHAICAAEDEMVVWEPSAGVPEEQVRANVVVALEQAFSVYPSNYQIRVNLPMFYNVMPREFAICDGMSLDFRPTESRRNSANLVVRMSGYCSLRSDNALLTRCFQRMKVFMFLLQFTRLTRESASWVEVTGVVVDEATQMEFAVAPPVELTKLFQMSRLRARGILSDDDVDRSAEAVATRFQERLAEVGRLMQVIFSPGNESMSTAIEWYVDSNFVANQTVALLEVCIGMESILGEEADIMKDMTNRLCDRLAFMLGRTREERSTLSRSYKKVLTVRGKLVHGKQALLGAADAEVLKEGRGLLKRVIEHELAQLVE